jgi:ABC-type transporter Mla subunit MlaD
VRTHGSKRLPNWAIGLIAIVVIAIASVLAYTKSLPWADPYEVTAVFDSAQNVRVKSPVRIAGVNVGEVTKVEHLDTTGEELVAQSGEDPATLPGPDEDSGEAAAVVTMKLNEEALPLHEDARFKLRPRLFLEGNLFVDVKTGSPNAPETDEGHQFPVTQTSNTVQLDQVLTTLQSDVRGDLQTFLDQFGNALIKYEGAEAFNELYRSSAGAGKYTSQVNNAILGERPHDLSGLIRNLDRVLRALGQNEATLQDLVTNFRVFSGSFAAQDQALERAIANLPDVLDAARPAFANLNASFPPLRAFAREALPGVRSTPETIDAALPFVHQLRRLVSKPELRGLVHDLRPAIPKLARLASRTRPFLRQSRALSSCFNEVVIPWSHDTVDPAPGYPFAPQGEVSEETLFGLVGIGGESRSGDANGQTIKVGAGGGTNTVTLPAAGNDFGETAYGVTPFPLLGAMPKISDSAKTPFTPGVNCETQDQPDLGAGLGTAPSQTNAPAPAADDQLAPAVEEIDAELVEELQGRWAEATEEEREGAADRLAARLYEELFDEDARRAERDAEDGGGNGKGGKGDSDR